MTGWRERIKVHPAAELLPMMSDDELDVLGADIFKNRMTSPIILWTPQTLEDTLNGRRRNPPKEIYLLDGRNRLEAIERAFKDKEEREEVIQASLSDDNSCGFGSNTLYGDVDPYTFVISANIQRRHLTPTQKRDLIAELLKAKPERSDRATSKIVQVDGKTVATVRKTLEKAAEIPQLAARVGTDGKARPAKDKRHVPLDDPSRPRNRASIITLSPKIVEKAPIRQVTVQVTRGYSLDSPTEKPPNHGEVIRPNGNLLLCQFLLCKITDPDEVKELRELILQTWSPALKEAFDKALAERHVETLH